MGTRVGGDSDETARWAEYNKRLTHSQRTLRHGLRELRAVATALEASELVTEHAAHLFRRTVDNGLLTGYSIEAMAAACVHVIAREQHVPFPLEQVGELSPVTTEEIKTAVSKLMREFDLRIVPPLPTSYIDRFASEVGLSTDVRRRAYQIAQEAIEEEIHIGQSPTGIAAAALYGAAKSFGENINQEEIASVAYVSVVTLSRQWQRLKPIVNES